MALKAVFRDMLELVSSCPFIILSFHTRDQGGTRPFLSRGSPRRRGPKYWRVQHVTTCLRRSASWQARRASGNMQKGTVVSATAHASRRQMLVMKRSKG